MRLQSNHQVFSERQRRWYRIRLISGLIGILLLAVITTGNYFTRNNWITVNRDICEKERMEEFRGTIDTCYIDYNNKGTFTAFIRTERGLTKTTNWRIDFPQAYIQKEDSVTKNGGAFKYTIYRKGSEPVVVEQNFDCSYWEKFRK